MTCFLLRRYVHLPVSCFVHCGFVDVRVRYSPFSASRLSLVSTALGDWYPLTLAAYERGKLSSGYVWYASELPRLSYSWLSFWYAFELPLGIVGIGLAGRFLFVPCGTPLSCHWRFGSEMQVMHPLRINV